MSKSGKKSRKPIELSSIINVVQRSPKSCHKSSHHKMELKSVVHVKSGGSNTSMKAKSRQDHRSSKSSKLASEKPLLLLPFGHQVSGRASMLCYDETTILKPYVSRELFFYQSMPQKLEKFTPQFRGLVTVSFVEDSSTTSMLAYALPCTLVKPNAKSIIKLFAEEPKPHSKRCVKDFGKTHVIYPDQSMDKIMLCDDEDTECSMFVEPVTFDPIISTDQDDDVVSDLSQGFDTSVCIDDTTESSKENRSQQKFSTTGLQNPWNAKVLDDAWLKLKVSDGEDPSSGKKKRFTLLENVVACYRRPCVLDLKIGTRIRENASDDKVARHVTAINIGARLSGMQIYHPDKEQFSYHNKYYGHNLSVAGFKANLRHFFSRGTYPVSTKKEMGPNTKFIDRNLVKEAIRKLKKLKDIIDSMQSHRFYSSSLLLLYEGDVSLSTMKVSAREYNKSSSSAVPSAMTSDVLEISPRSFSFSEFLQRLKHDKHDKHSTRSLDIPAMGDQKNRTYRSHREQDLDSQKSTNAVYQSEKKHKRPVQSSKITSSHDCKSSKHRAVSSHQTNHSFHERGEIETSCHIRNGCEKIRGSHKPVDNYEGDLSSHHKPVTLRHSEKAMQSQVAHSSSNSCGSCQSQSVKSLDGLTGLPRRGVQRSCDRSCSEIRESQRPIPFAWKSWPTRSKRMKMNTSTSQDNESIDFNSNGCHEMDCVHGLHSDFESHDTNHHDAIDVRMIDFAHYCFRDNTMHPGPDKSFTFGLDNLIVLLNDMLKL